MKFFICLLLGFSTVMLQAEEVEETPSLPNQEIASPTTISENPKQPIDDFIANLEVVEAEIEGEEASFDSE